MTDIHDEKWREDFPTRIEKDEFITRRDFTRFLLLVSGGFAAGNAWILGKTVTREGDAAHAPLDICAADEMQPGQWRVFHYPGKKDPAILIRRRNGEFTAFHQKCTHLACPVAYDAGTADGQERLVCHCHNGKFDIATGQGTAGPPRELRPLPRIDLRVENGRVMATGISHGEKKNG